MSAIAETAIDGGDHLAKRNALVLALAQALAGGNSVVIVGTAGIVGGMLADKAFATVPVSTYVLGMWIGTLPVGVISKKFGRLAAFELGALCGAIAGLLCCLAVLQASFALLCAGTLFGGFYASVHQSYRFAAADTASDAFKAKAISWVMAGGVFSAFVGPQLVIVTKDLWPPHLFAASYLAQAGVAILSGLVLLLVRIPRLIETDRRMPAGRPLSEIFRQPRLIVAVVCGVASYSMMNLVMTSAPVAMLDCNHSVTDATLGLQWHVMAMFAPSFFTGTLIGRFGTDRVAGCGLAIIAAGALLALTGITIWHFWAALVLLGVGWNFAFVGATALVTQCHRPNERNKVQAVNDFLVFGSMALGSFSSGALLARYGWNMVAEVVLPVVLVAGVLLVGVNLMARPKPA
ncbi:MAG TPA: MFS transporter [Xanthobacteraceae bacterium]|jgi:MFS family permease|nr:MFS transporter [Xanthobacteraceae bacterium]